MKKRFNILGWILLIGTGISWIIFGYSSWYLLIIPIAYISFSIEDGRIKQVTKMKRISLQQILFVIFALLVSVSIAFGLIQLANYLINDILQLTGWGKTFSQFIAVILSLYPAKIIYGGVVYKVVSDLNTKKS